MKIIDIKRQYKGNFISYYLADYLLNDGTIKQYELVSRDQILTIDSLGKGPITGVGLVVFDASRERVLLQKEFRLAINEWILTFPAGLIDAGETLAHAAKRELKEETGVDLIEVIDCLPPCFTCQGFSDEKMTILICVAKGDILPSIDPAEEIKPKWYTKEEIKKEFALKTPMSVRTQMFLWQWIN